jgi:hypothetical protein
MALTFNKAHDLADPYPARQDGHIGNEADTLHQLVALIDRIQAQYLQGAVHWN